MTHFNSVLFWFLFPCLSLPVSIRLMQRPTLVKPFVILLLSFLWFILFAVTAECIDVFYCCFFAVCMLIFDRKSYRNRQNRFLLQLIFCVLFSLQKYRRFFKTCSIEVAASEAHGLVDDFNLAYYQHCLCPHSRRQSNPFTRIHNFIAYSNKEQ